MKDFFYFHRLQANISNDSTAIICDQECGIGFSNETERRDIAYYALVIELSQMSEENFIQDESSRVAVIRVQQGNRKTYCS